MNYTQANMLEALHRDGYDIKERELSRLRKKKGLQMRAANSSQALVVPAKRKSSQMEVSDEKYDPAIAQVDANEDHNLSQPAAEQTPTLPPEVQEKRQKHLEKLQIESEKRYKDHTRRRRTRPWAGLPADPPAPPRFPSETTIDEAKHILGLDHKAYVGVREQFQSICEQENIRKKTEAGDGQWQYAKDRLATENQYLHLVFFIDEPVDHTQHNLALDVICSDVTKRMRTLNNRLTIQECKNILRTNPEEARQLRKSFEDILRAGHFTSKLEAGPEHWNELKRQWLRKSLHLQELLREGEADPEYRTRVKAMELICRDVMKRLRDEHTRKDPTKKQNAANTAHALPQSPATQGSGVELAARALAATPLPLSHSAASSQMRLIPPADQPVPTSNALLAGIADYSDFQIDPKLLAASDPSLSLACPR